MSHISQTENANKASASKNLKYNVVSKKPYQPPQITLITELKIENNSSGFGDGDAFQAHS